MKAKEAKKNKFVKNTISVVLTNLILLVSGLLSGFFVPKFLGEFDYGLFKSFTLYASYVTFFQFGFVNGIFILYGGYDYQRLDLSKMRFYTRFLLFLETIISLLCVATGFLFFSNVYRILVLCLAMYSISTNLFSYFQQISQITQSFKRYNSLVLLQSALKIIAVAILFLLYRLGKATFTSYVILYTGIFVTLFVSNTILYREIIFGKSVSFRDGVRDLPVIFKTGLPLLAADFVVILVYACDRQIVDIFFTKEEFGQFSFAYTILNLLVTVLSALSTVIYPALKRLDPNQAAKKYDSYLSTMLIVGFACLLSYFPLRLIVSKFLPNYVYSLNIFRIIFPGVILTSAINIIVQNYYKSFKFNGVYFFVSLGAFLFSVGTNLLAYYIFKTMESIAFASIFTFLIWFFVAQAYLKHKINIKFLKNYLYALLAIVSFYLCVFLIDDAAASIIAYAALYLILTLVLYSKKIENIIHFHWLSRVESTSNVGEKHTNRVILKAAGWMAMTSISTFAMGFFIFDASEIAISYSISKNRTSPNNCNLVVLESSKPQESWITFRINCKDATSSFAKESSYVFYTSAMTSNTQPPFRLYSGSNSEYVYEPTILLNYSPNFAEQYYGFELIDGSAFMDLNQDHYGSNSFYITQDLADDIIMDQCHKAKNEILDSDYEALLEKKTFDAEYFKDGLYYEASGTKFELSGIIKQESLSLFSNICGSKFAFFEYDAALYYFSGDLNLMSLMHGGAITTRTNLHFLKLLANYSNEYTLKFYDFGTQGYYVGPTNQMTQRTMDFYNSKIRYIFGSVCALLLVFCAFKLFRLLHRCYLSSTKRYSVVLSFIVLLVGLSLYLLLNSLNGTIVFGICFCLTGEWSVALFVLIYTLIAIWSCIENCIDRPEVMRLESCERLWTDIEI